MPTAAELKPEQFAEWRSGSSHAQFMAQVAGMNTALHAVVQRLQMEGAADLAQQIKADVAQLQSKCQSVPSNLAQSPVKARTACSKAIEALKTRLQGPVGEQLDLTLGFTEGDGD